MKAFWLGYICGGCSWMLFWFIFMHWQRARITRYNRRIYEAENIFERRRE